MSTALQPDLFAAPALAAPPAVAIGLRDYQREALDAMRAAYARGVTRQLMSLPTGAGKTVLAAHAVGEWGLPAVMLVHRDELVRQSVAQLQRINPGLTVGVCQAERDELGADLIVASVQTLAREHRLARLCTALPTERLVISDEAHHDVAPTRRRTIERLDPTLLIGLTATAHRSDQLGLGALYQEIVFHLPMLTLMAMGQLARLKGLRIETDADLDQVHTVAGEFKESELADAVNTPSRNALIVASWRKHAVGRQRTIAFCVDVAHARALRDAFRADGVTAEMVIGETPSSERSRIFEAFRHGEIAVLTGCMVFTEGYDEPGIDAILMARPTKSQGLYIQMVGRGARKSPHKDDCLVIDFVDGSRRHSMITLPTLAGDETAGGASSERVRTAGEVIDLLQLDLDLREVAERRAVEVNLFGGSAYLWRSAGGYWMAPAGENGWLTILEHADGWKPYLVTHPRGEGPSIRALLDRTVDAEMAIGVAEATAPLSSLNRKDANWRTRDDPPSEGQLRIARFLRIPDASQLSKGALSAEIDGALFVRAMHELKRAKEQR